MCVQDKTSGCKDSERLHVENTFKYITDHVMAMCYKKREGHGDMCPAKGIVICLSVLVSFEIIDFIEFFLHLTTNKYITQSIKNYLYKWKVTV